MNFQSLCVFGDSLAKGVVFDAVKQKYYFAKDSFINLFCGMKKLNCNNYSRFGCTVTKGEKIVNQHSSAISSSDFTVLEFGGNDADFNWKEISDAPDEVHEANTPLLQFIETYKRILEKIVNSGGRPIILNMPPLDPQRYFNWISTNLNPANILKWLGGNENFIYRFHEMYNVHVHRLGALLKVPIVDIRSAFLAKSNYSDYLCIDGIHPNEAGHELISQTIRAIVNDNLHMLSIES